jgi:hypothetical protein
VWGLPHSWFDSPMIAFPEDGIRGQCKAVGTETPPTALLFWPRSTYIRPRVYFEDEPGRRSAAKFSAVEARRIAIAKIRGWPHLRRSGPLLSDASLNLMSRLSILPLLKLIKIVGVSFQH